MLRSVDNLNDPVSAWIDQYRPIVHHGITIFGHAILTRDFIVSDPARGQIGANPHFPFVPIGRNSALRDIAAKPRPAVLGDAARYRSHPGADRSSHRPADHGTRGVGGGLVGDFECLRDFNDLISRSGSRWISSSRAVTDRRA